MIKKILRYDLQLGDEVALQLPRGAEVLTAQVQGGRPVLWALVDPDEPRVLRRFQLHKTGEPAPGFLGGERHLATLQVGEDAYHLFEAVQ